MYLNTIKIEGLRNLSPTSLAFSKTANLIYGDNGSGKTSLLEAIYLLSRGRSFRCRLLTPIIHESTSACTVFGAKIAGVHEGTIGISRHRHRPSVSKLNGNAVLSSAELAKNLPTQVVNAESFALLEGGPQFRRRFIDWGVFHVEHSYQAVWQRFQRLLKQRNSLLKSKTIDEQLLNSWDREFSEAAIALHGMRQRYLEQIIPSIHSIIKRLSAELADIDLHIQAGWDEQQNLLDVLQQDKARDISSGRTNHGPHRADLKLKCGKMAVADMFSRGQLKLLAVAMLLAQGYFFQQQTGDACLYLIDDLPAELDKKHREKVCELLYGLNGQVFVTGVDKDELLSAWPQAGRDELKMFHVEQGNIAQQDI